MSEKVPTAVQIAAQLWCRTQHADKVMDPRLCQDIADEIREAEKRGLERALKMAALAEDLRLFIQGILGPDAYGKCMAVEAEAVSIRAEAAKLGKP